MRLLRDNQPQQDRLVETSPLTGAQHPHGLRINGTTGIAYVACDENNVLLTINLA